MPNCGDVRRRHRDRSDDSNPLELAKFCLEKDVDLFIGGVKERPIAYKLGIGFCDHNHERKEALAGYVGMLNFAREVHASCCSPVWQYMPRRASALIMNAECRMQNGGNGGCCMSSNSTFCIQNSALGAEGADRVPRAGDQRLQTLHAARRVPRLQGIAGTVPFLHGSQGCATYIRRYLISHFREPMDIAASNFAEHAANKKKKKKKNSSAGATCCTPGWITSPANTGPSSSASPPRA